MAGDDAATRLLVSGSLDKIIAEAEARNDVIAKSTPGEKPPLGDGIPWQGFPDTPPKCIAGSASEQPGAVEIEIEYHFPDQQGAGWKDALVIRTDEGRPAIDDVLYVRIPPDSRQLGLRRILNDAFDQ